MGIYNGNNVTLTSRPRVGINLEDSAYYSAEVPFNNIAMQIAYVSSSGGGWNNGLPLAVNASGYPSGTFPFNHTAIFILQMSSGHPPGFYNVSWTPTGVGVTVSNSVQNPYTFLKGTGIETKLITVTSGITSLKIHRSGDSTSYGSVFREPYIRKLKNFDTLRFMDWLYINYERGAAYSWENRVQPGYFTQSLSTGSGVAFEYIIDLCNETDSNPWICIHHQATTDFVIHLAELFKQRLKPGLKVYLEHSNEVWNSGFPQRQFCIDNGPSGLPTIPRGLAYHQQKTAEYGQIFKASGVPTVTVLGWQNQDGATFLDYAETVGYVPSGAPLIDAVAIAPYFGGLIVNDAAMISGCKAYGTQWTLGECWRDLERQRVHIRNWVSGAAKRGWDLLAYEGGQHLGVLTGQQSDTVFVQNFTDTNRHEGMYELYRSYLQMWHEETDNSLMVLFNSCYTPSQFGNWGLQEYEGQPNAPKYRAVMDHISQFRPSERGRY